MIPKPESLAEAHEEIYRLVELLHRQQQKVARRKRMTELLKRVPADLAERLGPTLIEAMAQREGEKGAAAAGLLAHIGTSKFGDHLPTYRQEEISDRHGWMIPRTTQCGWLRQMSGTLTILVALMAGPDAAVPQDQYR